MTGLVKKRKSEWDAMMKEAIHDAAVSVLTEHGTGGLTMERVAQAAGVATGTLYNYIGSKDELVLYLLDRSFAPYHKLLLDIRDSGLPPDKQLERYFQETFAALERQKRSLTVLYAASGGFRKSEDHAKSDIIVDIIAGMVAEGIEQGCFRACDPRWVARLITNAVFGVIESRLAGADDFRPVEDDVRDCMDLFFSGLLPRD